jgi:hypothetical protein
VLRAAGEVVELRGIDAMADEELGDVEPVLPHGELDTPEIKVKVKCL